VSLSKCNEPGRRGRAVRSTGGREWFTDFGTSMAHNMACSPGRPSMPLSLQDRDAVGRRGLARGPTAELDWLLSIDEDTVVPRIALAVAAMVGVVVAVPTLATSGTSPTSWRWTTSQAQKYAFAAAPQLEFQSGGLTLIADDPRSGSSSSDPPAGTNPKVVTHCRGAGKGVAKHYSSFRCSLRAKELRSGFQPTDVTKTLWLKIRRQGGAQFCSSIVSLRAIPAACLNPSGTRSRKVWRLDALIEVDDWVSALYEEHPLPMDEEVRHQIFYGYGAGYFEYDWWIVNQDNDGVPLETHTATVIVTSKWKVPSGGNCVGAGCPAIPGLVIKQTS
jgi:hypothetical protein